MIDAHVHFWKYDKVRDSWIDDSMTAIRQDFLPSDIDGILVDHHIHGIVAVQADQSLEETRFLLKLAEKYPKIKGVVGWIDFLSHDFEDQLQKFKEYPVIKGWRHIVQAEPKGFLSQPQFVGNIRKLQAYGYTYDILIYHSQMEEVIQFVRQVQDQKLILDHMGKPDIKNLEIETWKKNIIALARSENVHCKLSGLVTEAAKGKWTKEMLEPYLDIVFTYFGTSRILFGSDWPVMLLNTNYSEWLQLVKEYIQQLSREEQQQILEENAIHFYNL
ncbi:amidohydrolase [Chryseobacterium lactis]|uniref:Amidohydrolase n=1 Tax=Chryseobacterium lactis TaxID=1241981 RepID=A0A3G6RTT8_CHRLC|nr:amidohydrolase family protein [Chryseobacterium lactis]AZA84898.1 amidohydrolase [Chryseobacterium lactis]AZB05286.1 amidohydrolase [Chryseobacterium lactis]PNW12269.1 amidohydrolase [Chryseobacterium lactis]